MKHTIFILAIILWTGILHAQRTYYIDDVAGNDFNSGNSHSDAWKNLEKINNTVLKPGDSVLFRKGGIWHGNFIPQGSGDPQRKIVIGSYGSGPAPVLNARGEIAPGETASYTIKLFNQQYIEIRGLKIMNFKPFEVPQKHKFRNGAAYANSIKMGIYVQGEDCGSLNEISLVNLEVCDVNGSMHTKHNGGIFLEITKNEDPEMQVLTNFVDLLISNCWIHDVDRTGISNTSAWWDRSLYSTWGDDLKNGKKHNWYPSEGIIIRNNRFERTGANALIVRVAKAPLIEYNLFNECSIKGSGNASFPFNCDDALFQYNEACFTYYNTEADSWNGVRDADAGGFDSDWNCKNTIIQYNYSHDNGFGGILICNDGASVTGFNDGTVIRYNIFENNQHHMVRTAGPATNTLIYNNLFFSGSKLDSVKLIYHKDWNGYSDSVAYHNNIFYSEGAGNNMNIGKSSRNIFDNNMYWGKIGNLQDDPNKVLCNPMFTGKDNEMQEGWNKSLQYILRKDSPAIDRGIMMKDQPGEDYRGVKISGKPDIGPFEYGR